MTDSRFVHEHHRISPVSASTPCWHCNGNHHISDFPDEIDVCRYCAAAMTIEELEASRKRVKERYQEWLEWRATQ